ncbi:MAG: ABC transporter permease [Candidatus Omnitrophota bacterium]
MIEAYSLWLAHEIPLLIHSGFLKGAPLLWAAAGGAFSERSGVINIGLEGMMLTGAFAGAAVSWTTGDPWLGALAAAMGGGSMGLFHALVCLRWKADQIVSGMGINLMAMGMTGFLLERIFHARGNSPEVPKMPALTGSDASIPILSDLLFPLSPLHILLAIVILWTVYLFYHTRFGLRLRACGENPSAAAAAGVNVGWQRCAAVGLSGVLAGLGGAQLSLGDISQFSVGMTNGRGFVALAILICSGWRPLRAAGACLAFGCLEAMGERLQSVIPALPSRVLLLLPFAAALAILSLRRFSNRPPQALGKIE